MVLNMLIDFQRVFSKVQGYYQAKVSEDVKDEYGNFVEPLFRSLREPSVDQVGHLMSMNCGHNGKPSDGETMTIHYHLEAAGFVQPYPYETLLPSP